jgi:hypothetical protein
VDIVEPTKLRTEEVGTLWRYWRDSQRTNERPIYFIEALPKDVWRHEDGVMWPKGKSKSEVSSKKDKGKGKAKYVEPDNSSETSSDEEFEGLFGGSSEDDDDDNEENDGDEGNAGREVVKRGPPSGVQKNLPQVHIVMQIGQPGGSGLSDAAKQVLCKTSCRRGGES